MFAVALVVAVTLATSYLAYSMSNFRVSPSPAYSAASYTIYGSPSFLRLQVNSSVPTTPAELRLDSASSLSGILELTGSGYSSTGGLCTQGATTFFSVETTSGTLSVTGSGTTWIDGIQGASAAVQPGWHEVVISNGSGCGLLLPNGVQATSPTPGISSIPAVSFTRQSFLFFIPYYSTGHLATIVFDGGTKVVGF